MTNDKWKVKSVRPLLLRLLLLLLLLLRLPLLLLLPPDPTVLSGSMRG
jgi:hypothetical protein